MQNCPNIPGLQKLSILVASTVDSRTPDNAPYLFVPILLVFRPSFSIFVGDLDAVVTDDKLQDFFAKKYKSVKGAKIMYEEGGLSRLVSGSLKILIYSCHAIVTPSENIANLFVASGIS